MANTVVSTSNATHKVPLIHRVRLRRRLRSAVSFPSFSGWRDVLPHAGHERVAGSIRAPHFPHFIAATSVS